MIRGIVELTFMIVYYMMSTASYIFVDIFSLKFHSSPMFKVLYFMEVKWKARKMKHVAEILTPVSGGGEI